MEKIEELDDLMRRYISIRDTACVICGYGGNLETAHLFKRRFMETRFHPEAVFSLCHRCHEYEHKIDGNYFIDWFIRKYGQKKYDELLKLSKKSVKVTEEWITEKTKQLQALIKNIRM